jgi:hypothetical protein
MGVLTQLQPPPSTALPTRKSALQIATELASKPLTAPKPVELIESVEPTKCPQCLDTSWWLPIGLGGPICFRCKPPTSLALVAKQYFFDDWGNSWTVEKNQDGSISYIRETFELGSPDVKAVG